MNKKSILISIISIFLFSILFSFTLVYAGSGLFNNTTKIAFKLSNNVFLDSITLNRNQIMFKSGDDLSGAKINSSCDIYSNLKFHKGDYYLFEIKFFNNKCDDNDLILVSNNGEKILNFSLNIVKEYDALSNLLDINTQELKKISDILNVKVKKYSKYKQYNPNIEKNYYKYLHNNRLLKESIYNANLVKNILEKRSEKYIVPLAGHKLPTMSAKVPNSGRGYRADYTDGIHHGWDVDGDFGEQILAIDDGIIVRVVNNFRFDDLNKIKRGDNLTDDDKVKNLDILRGNQVWLKTMKGDVVFYSHLNEIFTNIEVGEVVKKGQPIGTIGITGVPDKNYKDFHIHFPIQVNPHNKDMVGKYDMEDYLKWDWLFKGKSIKDILKDQYSVFES